MQNAIIPSKMKFIFQLCYCMFARTHITLFCGAAYLYFCTYICLNKLSDKTKSVSGAITCYTPSISFSMGLWDNKAQCIGTAADVRARHMQVQTSNKTI